VIKYLIRVAVPVPANAKKQSEEKEGKPKLRIIKKSFFKKVSLLNKIINQCPSLK